MISTINQFVPLVPPTANMPAMPAASQANAPGHGGPFAPLTPNPPTALQPNPRSHSSHAELTFTRDGDRITQIQVRCSCGEVHTLECDYSGSENHPAVANAAG